MKILIKKEAGDMYISENTSYDGIYFGDPVWEDILFRISGKVLEVDTEELFKHEFNTKPIKGISEMGIRIPETYVEKVINDIRPGKARCELCNRTSESDKVCTHCGRSDYLEPFTDEY